MCTVGTEAIEEEMFSILTRSKQENTFGLVSQSVRTFIAHCSSIHTMETKQGGVLGFTLGFQGSIERGTKINLLHQI